ncbi:CPBP family intramembrane metalloprotease [Roseovarius spongiae]|uniref:CPBP family intramembrane metalloprotease n=1 Tax=Roseovarius spongiae TaxID=2320272 RepID=A0A3A8AQV3_9RHOB|nr:CPBP family intramembrane glutamic endopeptidase [Roseovarius spongiae]RKF12888.1 CPBP family intramembrane metalloprotease [Roseovarius spongiae]
MRYGPHQFLIAPARGSEEPWRLLAGCALIVALFLLMSLFYSRIIAVALPDSAWGANGRGVEDASTPWGALANLYIFGLVILALWVVLTVLHTRTLSSLLGASRPAWRQFRRVLVALALLTAAVLPLPAPEALTPGPHLALPTWLAFLPLALLGLAIQTGTEEIVFRGYLQSQLAARFRRPLVWMGLPSALFAALHYAPGNMGDNAWLAVMWAFLFGLAAADLTARSGTLGPAIALHIANNFSAILLAAPEGSFDGLALYTYPFALHDTAIMRTWAPIDMMMLLCSWLAARLALRA